jgi:subtilisin family serine protease
MKQADSGGRPNTSTIARAAVLLTVLLLGLPLTAGAGPYPLIVQIAPGLNIVSIVAALGGTLIDSIPDAGTYLLNLPAIPSPVQAGLLGIQWLELNQGVTLPGFIQLGVVAVPATVGADWYKYQPAMVLVRSGPALSQSTGRGIVVADLNSRLDVAHPALVGHLTSGYDFVANQPAGAVALNQSSASFMDQSGSFLDQSSASFMDQSSGRFIDQLLPALNPAYSHGTLCAGIIAVVAPDSMIMPLRVFDDRGSSDLFTIAKAIRYAVQQGAEVINMSFGTLGDSQALKSAIKFALDRNVVLVASAGNNNTSAPQFPAGYPGVMAAAATDLADRKAAFSNYGPSVYVDAPGVNIFSSYPGGYYSVVSGTSFSAPIVAAAAALIRSLRRTDPASSIATGAVNIDSRNPSYANQLGYGRVDVLRAVSPD